MPPQLGPGEYYAVRIHQWPAAGPGADIDLRSWAAGGGGRVLTLVDGRTQRDAPLATCGVSTTSSPACPASRSSER